MAMWTEVEAAHLLGRASFAATELQVQAAVSLGMEETVGRLLAGESLTGDRDPVVPIEQVKADGKPLQPDKIVDQETYWLYRMVNTEAPLFEKMALFWHGHFATSYQKVRDTGFMVRQNELFRSKGLGGFEELVSEVSKDPAMMVWLDANSNRKGQPNENYAREVMELFTLGIGHYTENDIRELARALTGWTVQRNTGEVRFNPKQHDDGTKTILGETGAFDEQSAIHVLFDQQALPVFLAGKLLAFFGSPNPSPQWLAQTAADFATGPTIGDVLRKLFQSDAFYDQANRQAIVKSPAEYAAGLVKSLGLPLSNNYVQAMRRMGQELYFPPDVAGWRGGPAWLASANLLARCQFAQSTAARAKTDWFPSGKSPDAATLVQQLGNKVGIRSWSAATQNALLQYADDTVVHAGMPLNGLRGLLTLMLASPEAQMK